MLVGLHYQVPAGKGRDQHKEGGFRGMEIGEEPVHKLELVARVDEYGGGAAAGRDEAAGAGRFKSAHGCGPHRSDLLPGGLGLVEGVGNALWYGVGFGMHLVVFDILGADREECAGSHMECDLQYLCPLCPDGIQDCIGEVEPCGGGCHRAKLLGVYGLVAL